MNTRNLILIITVAIIVVYLIVTFIINKPTPTDADVDSSKFEELTSNTDAVILDVRSAFEFKGDKIKGAQNISISQADFNSRISALDKEKTYLVYCQVGNRSTAASKIMKDLGFKNVYNLIGGIENWKHNKKSVVR